MVTNTVVIMRVRCIAVIKNAYFFFNSKSILCILLIKMTFSVVKIDALRRDGLGKLKLIFNAKGQSSFEIGSKYEVLR